MLDAPPRERESTSWALLVAWTLVIWAAVPFAPALRDVVALAWGRSFFTYAVIAVIVAAALTLLVRLRRRQTSLSAPVWLVAVGIVFAWYAWALRDIPEEAVHLVEYAVLGLLSFRAFSHRLRDPTIYLCGTAVGTLVGIVDEGLQWVAPNRYWTGSDLGINLVASALVQVAIARGLEPKIIGQPTSAVGWRYFARCSAAVVVVLAATLLNTPERIGWYATRVPGLEFLLTTESVMFEYGYLYEDPEAGIFRSRLPPDALSRADRERGVEVGRILDAYPEERYKEFLNTYTPVSDPFAHEARVHLYSRDKRRQLMQEPELTSLDFATHAKHAYREHMILERFFPNTLAHSGADLAQEEVARLDEARWPEARLRAKDAESWVSGHLVTRYSEGQVMLVLLLALLGCVAVDVAAGRYLRR